MTAAERNAQQTEQYRAAKNRMKAWMLTEKGVALVRQAREEYTELDRAEQAEVIQFIRGMIREYVNSGDNRASVRLEVVALKAELREAKAGRWAGRD